MFRLVTEKRRVPKPDARLKRTIDFLEDLPAAVREAAKLRGLGYSPTYIGSRLGLDSASVVTLLLQYHRPLKSLRSAIGGEMLSGRAANSLGLCGIHSLQEARRRGLDDVLEVLGNLPNCGASTRQEVVRWMSEEVSPQSDEGTESLSVYDSAPYSAALPALVAGA
jgi:hypothetical protein